MPKDIWKRDRDRDHAKRAKVEIADGVLRSYEYVWDDGTGAARAESNNSREGTGVTSGVPIPPNLAQRTKAMPVTTRDVEKWVEDLRNGRDFEKRAAKVRLTTKASSSSAVIKRLVALLDDKDSHVAKVANGALVAGGSLAAQLIVKSLINNPGRAATFIPALVRLGNQATTEATTELTKQLDHSSMKVRNAVSQAVIAIGRPAVPSLVERLLTPSRTKRRQTIDLLVKMESHSSQAVPALVRLSRDSKSVATKSAATYACREIRRSKPK